LAIQPPWSPTGTGTGQSYEKRDCSVKEEPPTGAYGLRIAGLDTPRLQPADPAWPLLTIIRETPESGALEPPGTVIVTDDTATVWIADGGRIDIERATFTVTIRTAAPITDDAVLHPYLALPAAFAGHWLGRRALHGGAFVHGDGAWALLADKGGGKSSTLGALLRRGAEVVSDDILVLDQLSLFAGPRSVDLRDEAASVLGGEPLGVVGARSRWRLEPEVAALVTPLRGFVHLRWGDAVRLESLAPEDRLRELIWHFVLRPGREDALTLLELAALPAWRFERPQQLAQLDGCVDQLLTALG
jgi:hypothetical protein